ncbi:MAG: MFS transporter [Candidatus Omnitrophica bacterium]|nr:MFS transporter [Candidatus Omnitrophota bacterium]
MYKKDKIKKSLKFSLLDGIFASIMTGFITDYITPYALILKAKIAEIGTLNALPNFISSFVQLKAADLTQKLGGRKKIINIFIFLHTLIGIPIILIPYLFKKNHQVLFLIIFVTLFNSLNAMAMPAWSSLIADHIPANKRGKYFGWRNKILVIVTIISSFIAGSILHIFRNNILKGFLVIFTIAFSARFISWYFLTRMYEPPLRLDKNSYFTFFEFIKRLKESNFVKFVLFVASFNFCVNLAAPFFSVFMLRDLKFNYFTYTILVTTVPLTNIFFIDRWGKIADKIGNLKIIQLNSIIISSLPFLWILNQNAIYLIFIQILSGFAWSGFGLCTNNFIYDTVTSSKRVRCIAYFNALVGFATCCGSLVGGFLVNRLPPLFSYKILTLFFISSSLRFLVALLLSKEIKEVRKTKEISNKEVFYDILGINSFK